MKKRQRKKLLRYCCPDCGGHSGFFDVEQLPTGRPVIMMKICYACQWEKEKLVNHTPAAGQVA